jgi:cell division protein FtsQ
VSALASARRLAPVKLLRGLERAAARPLDAIAGAALAAGPRLRRRFAIAALVAAVLGAGYLLWLRDSGLVAVEDVQVTGLTGRDAERVRTALDGAARGMTTLHVDRDALEAAAAPFPVVQAIEVEADFPSGLRITVTEHRPVAVVVSGERRIPVAGDGSVLSGLPTEGSLPEIRTGAAIPAARLEAGPTLDAARVAGGAPGVLVPRLDQVESADERGLVVGVENGPELIFGTAERLTAKWAAAVRVLADPEAAGAEYLDLRLPERPAAGGLAVETVVPVAPIGEPQP